MSSLVMATSDSELSRTAWRNMTASNQPGRRRRPLLVPYSWPTLTKWSPSRISAASTPSRDLPPMASSEMASSVGNGPVPTRVTYALATPITRSM